MVFERKVRFGMIFLSSLALAQPALAELAPMDPIKRPAAGYELDESSEIRANHQYGAGARMGLGAALNFVTTGVEAFWGKDLQIGMSYYQARTDFRSELSDAERESIPVLNAYLSYFGLSGRYFLGNSFYIGYGMGHRRVMFRYLVEEGSNSVSGDILAESLIVVGTVGNIWSFTSGLFLGADWFVANIPFRSGYRVTTEATGQGSNFLQLMQQTSEEIADHESRAITLGSLQLFLGYAF